MSLTLTTPGVTTPQFRYLVDLLAKRDYLARLDRAALGVSETIDHTLANAEFINAGRTDDLIFISRSEASAAIDFLLSCRPSVIAAPAVGPTAPGGGFNSRVADALTQVLATLPPANYALPRRADPDAWDFFQVREARSGRRYVVQLLGSPGSWNRRRLDVRLQLAAARAVASDVRAAALAYSERHGRCAGCDAKLSDPTSIALSMGPVCRKKFGL